MPDLRSHLKRLRWDKFRSWSSFLGNFRVQLARPTPASAHPHRIPWNSFWPKILGTLGTAWRWVQHPWVGEKLGLMLDGFLEKPRVWSPRRKNVELS